MYKFTRQHRPPPESNIYPPCHPIKLLYLNFEFWILKFNFMFLKFFLYISCLQCINCCHLAHWCTDCKWQNRWIFNSTKFTLQTVLWNEKLWYFLWIIEMWMDLLDFRHTYIKSNLMIWTRSQNIKRLLFSISKYENTNKI